MNTISALCVVGLFVIVVRVIMLPPRLLDMGAFCNRILAGLAPIAAGCGIGG